MTSIDSKYYNKNIKGCKGNQRTVFDVVNKVEHTNQRVLPNNIKPERKWQIIILTSFVRR